MIYQWAANLVLILHLGWIIFLLIGLPVGLITGWRWWRLAHAGGLLLAVVLQLTQIWCPLTILEEWLRHKVSPGFSYHGSFIISMVDKLVYPDWISLNAITWGTLLLTAATVISFWLKPINARCLNK